MDWLCFITFAKKRIRRYRKEPMGNCEYTFKVLPFYNFRLRLSLFIARISLSDYKDIFVDIILLLLSSFLHDSNIQHNSENV